MSPIAHSDKLILSRWGIGKFDCKLSPEHHFRAEF